MLDECIEIITVGLPFCVFKLVSGMIFHQYWLVALGIIDLLINLVNLVSSIFFKKRVLDTCVLSFLVHKIKKPQADIRSLWLDLGNASDVFLSFALVAIVVGGGFILQMTPEQLWYWNLSVVLNVCGAGYGRLVGSWKNIKRN